MKTLSACLIVKDEELVIERCLKSLYDICDEINVVDTGSSDETINIINRLKNENDKIKLYHFDWCDDFSAARNFSFSKNNCDYLMWVDADEEFTLPINKVILDLKNNDFNNYNIITTPIKFYYKDTGDSNVVNRERIINADIRPYWKYAVHELLTYEVKEIDPSTKYKISSYEGCVFHEKLKHFNNDYYSQIYFNELNHKLFYSSYHYKFYYSWMCYYKDNVLFRKSAYNVFTMQPDDVDYREWYKDKFGMYDKCYEALELISMKPHTEYNLEYLYKKGVEYYNAGYNWGAYYIFNYLISVNNDSLYEKCIPYFLMILWNLNLVNDFFVWTNNAHMRLIENENVITNFGFRANALNKLSKIKLVIRIKKNKWKLPYLLYITNGLFQDITILTDQNVNDLLYKEPNSELSKEKIDSELIINENNEDYYLVIDENSIINTDIMGELIKKIVPLTEFTDIENTENAYIFTKNAYKIKEFLE